MTQQFRLQLLYTAYVLHQTSPIIDQLTLIIPHTVQYIFQSKHTLKGPELHTNIEQYTSTHNTMEAGYPHTSVQQLETLTE